MSTKVQLIGDNSVDSGSIVNATIKTEDILDGAVTESKIGTGAVTESKIGTGAVTNTKLAAASVTADKLASGAAIPSGVIVMWSGTTSNIPTGWVLCNGANGTPDLRDRFIVGAGSAYTPGNTGGANSVTLDSTQMPVHSHTTSIDGLQVEISGSLGGAWSMGPGNRPQNSTSFSMNNAGGLSGTTQAHENRPPYYALAYIMKS